MQEEIARKNFIQAKYVFFLHVTINKDLQSQSEALKKSNQYDYNS